MLRGRTFRYPSESESSTSDRSNEYEDAEEGPSTRTDTKEEAPLSPETEPEEERPLRPETERSKEEAPFGLEPRTNSEEEDLSSSFSAYGFNPFERTEPTKPTTAYTSLIQSLLEFNKPQRTETMASSAMVIDAAPMEKEMRMPYPKPFTGKRENLNKFIQDCELHLLINRKVYDEDLKKIGFILALMPEGEAANWKEQFVSNARKTIPFDLGTYAAFIAALEASFTPYDATGEALEKMKWIRMKQEDSIDDHVATFKTLVNRSKLDATSPVVIDMFRESLPPRLQTRILTLENAPKTLDNWYDQAVKLDHLWRRMKAITERTKSKTEGIQRRFVFPKTKDPNAMDIDAMSIEK